MKLKVLSVKERSPQIGSGWVSLEQFKDTIFDSEDVIEVIELKEERKGFKFKRIKSLGVGQMSPIVVGKSYSIINGGTDEVYVETEGFVMTFKEVE